MQFSLFVSLSINVWNIRGFQSYTHRCAEYSLMNSWYSRYSLYGCEWLCGRYREIRNCPEAKQTVSVSGWNLEEHQTLAFRMFSNVNSMHCSPIHVKCQTQQSFPLRHSDVRCLYWIKSNWRRKSIENSFECDASSGNCVSCIVWRMLNERWTAFQSTMNQIAQSQYCSTGWMLISFVQVSFECDAMI